MAEGQIIRVISDVPTWADTLLTSNLPTGVPEIYNTAGLVPGSKIYAETGNTVAGAVSFDMTSAGFTNILSASCFITSNDAIANQGIWSIITNLTITNCTVTTYFTNSIGVVVLGIPVIGSINTAIYTGIKNIKIIVIGN